MSWWPPHAAATPDEVAVVCGDGQLTYRELDARADALARRLRGFGVGPQSRVGVLLEPSLETVIASLAVLKAGGAYVPLDVAFPAERIEFMLTDAGASLVLAHPATAGSVPAGPWTVLDLDADLEAGRGRVRATFHLPSPVIRAMPATSSSPQAPPAGPRARWSRTPTSPG